MDRYDDALKDLNHSLSLDGNYIEALENRAQCFRKLAEEEQDHAKKDDLLAKAEADEQKIVSLKKENKA